jgi:hypothetical protein
VKAKSTMRANDTAFRRRGYSWQVAMGGKARTVEASVGHDQAFVSLDGAVVARGPLPTPQHRWLLLSVPGMTLPLAVAIVRFPNRRFRVATFLDSINVDDGSQLADWGSQAFAPMDRFEDNAVDNGVLRPGAALLFSVVFAYSYLGRHPITPARLAIALALAVGTASWVLFCGRVVVPYLASQHSWPVAVRNFVFAAAFLAGGFAIVLAVLSLYG